MAVLLVVLGHAGVSFLRGGFVGVDVFFVLSGFLITGLLLAEARKRGSVSLVDFYVRRARRILPAAALTLLVTNVAAFGVLNFVRAREAVEDGLLAGVFAANFRFASRGVDYFAQDDPDSPVLHYWSLSVEEQFYFVWPLLLSVVLFGVIARWRRPHGSPWRERRLLVVVVVLAGASLVYSIANTASSPATAYFSPFTRAWELGLGAAIAIGSATLARIPGNAKMVMGWVGLAAIGAAAVLFSEGTPFPGYAALLPTVGAALAIIAGIDAGSRRLSASRMLSVRPMLAIGDRSYALYLWHWPMLILAAAYAGHALSVPVKLVIAALAFLVSCVSFALVENPIRYRVRRRGTTALVVAVCSVALFSTSGLALAGIERAQERFEGPAKSRTPVAWSASRAATSTARGALPSVIAAVRAARRGAAIPSPLTPRISDLKGMPRSYAPANECIGHNVSSRIETKVCRMGDRASKRLIVLLGDSHAMMWLPSVVEIARRDGWAFVPLLRLGCTPPKWTTTYDDEGCQAWYRWAVGQIERLRPTLTLIGGNVSEGQSAYARASVEAMVSAAQGLAKTGDVVVIGDPEGLDRDPIDCLLSKKASMRTCTTMWPTETLVAYDDVARRLARSGIGFLPTRKFVCFERTCPAVIGGTIVWVDNNHLSAAYAAAVAPAFRAALKRVAPKTRG